MSGRDLILIATAVAIAVYGASLERQPTLRAATGAGYSAAPQPIGQRNHSRIEPYDLFGLRARGW